jgi:RNA polymerase-binding protein DksA
MKKKKPSNSELTPAEIKKFKVILLAKRNEILGNVSSMEIEALRQENSDLSKLPIHMADLGTDNFDQEFTLSLMEGERKLLTEINDALGRIEYGTFGICQGSRKPIPKARLEAIPWAKYCVEYASMLEKGLIRDDSYLIETGYDYGDDEPRRPFQRKAI